MTFRSILATTVLFLLPACGLLPGSGSTDADGPGKGEPVRGGQDPAGGPGPAGGQGPGGGPDEAGGEGAPKGGDNEGLPELSWTPGEIRASVVTASAFVGQVVETSVTTFDGDVGSRIGAMYTALEGTQVKKTGPAFVILSEPWGPKMNAVVAFPVAPETTVGLLPEGFTLEQLVAGKARAMVFQGPRSELAAADAALLAKDGRAADDGDVRIYVLLDRPEEAGTLGPKTKVMLRLSE